MNETNYTIIKKIFVYNNETAEVIRDYMVVKFPHSMKYTVVELFPISKSYNRYGGFETFITAWHNCVHRAEKLANMKGKENFRIQFPVIDD